MLVASLSHLIKSETFCLQVRTPATVPTLSAPTSRLLLPFIKTLTKRNGSH